MLLFYLTAVVALSLSFSIETSAWWVRGLCGPNELGLYLSRSNIYLYFGRTFTLAFNSIIALRIEKSDPPPIVLAGLGSAFVVSAFIHMTFLRGTPLTWKGMSLLRRMLFIPKTQEEPTGKPARLHMPLVYSTGLSCFAFSLGITVPLMLALIFPAYRLSLSYTGQLINSGGTLLLLFFVDQRLFRALDRGTLVQELPSFSAGRAAGFMLAGLSCFAVGLFGYSGR